MVPSHFGGRVVQRATLAVDKTADEGEIKVDTEAVVDLGNLPATDQLRVRQAAYVVLTDSSQLTSDGFEKLPDQIMYPYAEPYDLQKTCVSL
uniref:Uncharacterized protein n=1 Tax=Timema tahoe TaxID=61484 RepID=A0A7R9IQ13_9NEOP|nr:unnamed protein product [Timema tahoe]